MVHLRISPRYLGQMLVVDFCARCFWYLVQMMFKVPFDHPMPGLMYNLDNFEKAIVLAHHSQHEALPKWLDDLDCLAPAEFPSKLTMEFPKHDITLVGMPDAVYKKANGKLCLVDYKTARYKGEDDPFLPVYQTQLLGYVHLLEANKVGTVETAALVYFENMLKDEGLDPLGLLTDEGFNVPFRVKIHEVKIDRGALEPLLKQFRAVADRRMPPEGNDKCKNCGRLQKLLDDEVMRRNSEEYQRNKDGLARVISRSLEGARQKARLALESGDGDVVEDLVTDAYDTVPAAWDL